MSELTTEDVRLKFAAAHDDRDMRSPEFRYDHNAAQKVWERIRNTAFAKFDAWLAAHDALVRAEAWDEGAKWMRGQAVKVALGKKHVSLCGTFLADELRALPTSPPPTEDAETKHKNDVRAVKVAELRQARAFTNAPGMDFGANSTDVPWVPNENGYFMPESHRSAVEASGDDPMPWVADYTVDGKEVRSFHDGHGAYTFKPRQFALSPEPDNEEQKVGRVCPVCGARGTQWCSTVSGRDHKARWKQSPSPVTKGDEPNGN